jgi:hypothetical protein
MNWIYDEETYPNIYTLSTIREDGEGEKTFEMSSRKNDFADLLSFLDTLRKNKDKMVGFNNLGFDYPILLKHTNLPKNKSNRKTASLKQFLQARST